MLGVAGDEATLLAAACHAQAAGLPAALRLVADKGAATCAEKARFLLEWLSGPAAERPSQWSAWRCAFLLDDGSPRGPTTLVNKKLAEQRPELAAALLEEQQRVLAVEDSCRAARAAAASAALLRLAGPVVRCYAGSKRDEDKLDYDDLIGRTGHLLVDPGAAWVLYKLDGGLDHLLLDEVQDTAPAQWAIAGRLTEEFFAGEGGAHRTVFAVGDRKQSIYSFQGADPDQFDRWRDILRRRVEAVGGKWRDVGLNVSFRSAAPVLALVDAVFADPAAAQGVDAAGTLVHIADRAGHAGCGGALAAGAAAGGSAGRALDRAGAQPRLRSARRSVWPRRWPTGSPARPPAPSCWRAAAGRCAPGDVLVLVRRRNEFARALVRALKGREVPVAGLDRLVLTDQPAVADLLALCDVLLLPEDDLQLRLRADQPAGRAV